MSARLPAICSSIPSASTSASLLPLTPVCTDAWQPSQPPRPTRTTHTGRTRTRRATHIATLHAPAHFLCLGVREIAKRQLFQSRFQSRLGQGRIGFRPGPRHLREHRRESFHAATLTARSQPQTVYRSQPGASIPPCLCGDGRPHLGSPDGAVLAGWGGRPSKHA